MELAIGYLILIVLAVVQYSEGQQNCAKSEGGEWLSERQIKVIEGRTGKAGPPGTVDYSVVDEMITNKIKKLSSRPGGQGGAPGRVMSRAGHGSVYNSQIDQRISEQFEVLESKINAKLEKFEHLLNATRDLVMTRLGIEKVYPTSCKNVSRLNAKSWDGKGGVFDIYPNHEWSALEVYCDLTTDGGGWTVFQRREDGSVSFFRGWREYAQGFGEAKKEMWLGLETIYRLTKDGQNELRIDLGDWEGNTAYAKYGTFSIEDASRNYRLTVGDYFGNAGDAFAYQNGYDFTTKDRDHDTWAAGNCANRTGGAWWYGFCHHSNLNGIYYKGGKFESATDNGIIWYHWKLSWRYSLKFTEMKIRRKN